MNNEVIFHADISGEMKWFFYSFPQHASMDNGYDYEVIY